MKNECYFSRLVNSPSFVWKALRLLSRRSAHFFAQQPVSQQQRRVSEYLETLIDKIAKEMPVSCLYLLKLLIVMHLK